MWALATLLTWLDCVGGAQSSTTLGDVVWKFCQTSVAGENIIAYDLDRLFRSERRPQGVTENINYPRAEAGRIPIDWHPAIAECRLRTGAICSIGGNGDRVTPPDAERRVDQVIAQAKDNISRARRTGVTLGFMLGAAALLGAAAAWYVAIATGRYRDRGESLHPLWDWGRPASV